MVILNPRSFKITSSLWLIILSAIAAATFYYIDALVRYLNVARPLRHVTENWRLQQMFHEVRAIQLYKNSGVGKYISKMYKRRTNVNGAINILKPVASLV